MYTNMYMGPIYSPGLVILCSVSGVLQDPYAALWSVRPASSGCESSTGDEESWNNTEHNHLRILQQGTNTHTHAVITLSVVEQVVTSFSTV